MFRNNRLEPPRSTTADGNIRVVGGSDARPAGWVLAGGASSRMGRDKALIEIGGKPLVLAAAEALLTVCGAVSLVGNPSRYAILGLPVVPDRIPGLGPLSGIEAALAATASEWNVIVACDMPALDVNMLRDLVQSAEADGAVPRYPDGRIEPLCAVYHRRCHAIAADILACGFRRVSELVARLTVRYVQVTDARPFQNLNTPEDLESYRRG